MPINVLYLDDEPDLCNLFSEEFSSQDIQITTFTDPRRAIAHAKKTLPDIVSLDYRLPGMMGDIVAQEMGINSPMILITGDISVNTEYRFSTVIHKPFDASKIKKILQGCLQKKRVLDLSQDL